MTLVYILCFFAMAFGIVSILELSPERIGEDIASLLDRQKSLREQAMAARGKKRTGKIVLLFDKIRRALSETGREKSFGIACAISLLLMILGCVAALSIPNAFLAPTLAITLAMIPFLYLLKTVEQYEEEIRRELEHGLGCISTSYERSLNLKNAIEENLDSLKGPVRSLFEGFLTEITMINPNVKQAIAHLKEKVHDVIWEEWCDTLTACQDDSQLVGTLYPVVEKLVDARLVNAELKVMMAENKKEYYVMVLMVLGNIPLLYFLNKEWYEALMFTTLGKIVLAICGVVILFTFIKVNQYCKPIQYRREKR